MVKIVLEEKYIKHRGTNLKAVPHSKFKDVSELKTTMKHIINPEYELCTEDQAHLKKYWLLCIGQHYREV